MWLLLLKVTSFLGSECSSGLALGFARRTQSAAAKSQRQSVEYCPGSESREALKKPVLKNGEKVTMHGGRRPNEVTADTPDAMKGRSEFRSHCCPICLQLMVSLLLYFAFSSMPSQYDFVFCKRYTVVIWCWAVLLRTVIIIITDYFGSFQGYIDPVISF